MGNDLDWHQLLATNFLEVPTYVLPLRIMNVDPSSNFFFFFGHLKQNQEKLNIIVLLRIAALRDATAKLIFGFDQFVTGSVEKTLIM